MDDLIMCAMTYYVWFYALFGNRIIAHVRRVRAFNPARDRVALQLLTVTALDVDQDDRKES